MLFRFFFALIALSSTIKLNGQNLVPNSSFEDTAYCPTGLGQINASIFWTAPTAGSPDLFHVCNSGFVGNPNNSFGSQSAHSGNAYAGISVYDCSIQNYREYLQIELSEALEKNREVCIEFYLSLADYSIYAITNFGVNFSDSAISNLGSGNLNVPTQITTNALNFIQEKNQWLKISGSYITQRNDKFITIGNFADDNSTNFSLVYPNASGYCYAYYYIDDIRIFYCDEELTLPNVFSPNNDGVNDEFSVLDIRDENANIKIYNRWGEMITEYQPKKESWNGKTSAGKYCTEGIYYYVLRSNDQSYSGTIHLIR